jgi:hypothetical protein
MKCFQRFLGLALMLLLQTQTAQAGQLLKRQQCQSVDKPGRLSAAMASRHEAHPVLSYAVRYERYGFMGFYHVSLIVDMFRDGVHLQRFHIDGAGRFPQHELKLGFCRLKFRLPPPYLAGYVNPKSYRKHFLGLFTSNEFGPTYAFDDSQGTKLVSMSHHAMTVMNNRDLLLYCTFPFEVGPVQFWTSNSVVASLVKVANEEGIRLPNPVGGYYPGFKGPFLSKSLFVPGNNDAPLKSPMIGEFLFWVLVLFVAGALIKLVASIRSKLTRKTKRPEKGVHDEIFDKITPDV